MLSVHNRVRRGFRGAALIGCLAVVIAGPLAAHGQKKKKELAKPKPKPNILEMLDYSKIVWPNPPAITRIKYLDYFSAQKPTDTSKQKPSVRWMDRLAGVATGERPSQGPRFHLLRPYGLAVDSKGRIFIADAKVAAIFIFDIQTKDLRMIKNGIHARFGQITGLAIDDSDNLYVSDSLKRRVLVFDPKYKVLGSFSEGMMNPGGIAIDTENRFLYVADTDLDQVLVYDADSPYKLLRRIGTGGKQHTLTTLGDFAKPTNVAVDKEGNLYVADTLNNRVQIFDAEGNFIRTFGKPGDGPGYFARPRGIAVDGDGHVWVADGLQDRVQVFTPEGQLLIYMGEHGLLPGQFRALAGLAIDKKNRVFTSEQYPGRVQMFQYVSDADALAERQRRMSEPKNKPAEARSGDSR